MSDVLVVMTDPVPGREAEFDDWYDRVHLPEILALPSFTAARRYVLQDELDNAGASRRYLALYEVTSAAAASHDLSEARPGLTMSPALDRDRIFRGYFAALGVAEARSGEDR